MKDIANGEFDVIIVGAGIAGALVAKTLAERGKKVLILEAGEAMKPNNNTYLQNFYEATQKVPEAPYTPDIFAKPHENPNAAIQKNAIGKPSDIELADPRNMPVGRPTVLSISRRAWDKAGEHWNCNPTDPKINYFEQAGTLPFASTYERSAGGTARHWLGISLRHLPNDFRMGKEYQTFAGQDGKPKQWPDWPEELLKPKDTKENGLFEWYRRAETEIGVSGDNEVQNTFEAGFKPKSAERHGYPMPAIPLSYSDKQLNDALHANGVKGYDDTPLEVTPIPAARNSEPFGRRRACAGNSSCIPICPIGAKYDPTITLREAENTGRVTIKYRTVVLDVVPEDATLGASTNKVSHLRVYQYAPNEKPIPAGGLKKDDPRVQTATAPVYVLAANAIETPRLLLMSNDRKGIMPKDRPVGRYLMDHPFYIASALAKDPVFPYRGPLVTGGIEVLRDGDFRHRHAAIRVDVSNSGWSLSDNGTAQTLAQDFITGQNKSGMNKSKTDGKPQRLAGSDLVGELNRILTRQVTLGFLVEQTPDPENQVTLSKTLVDGLGLPRPRIDYNLSQYTKDGLGQAMLLAKDIFVKLGWDRYEDKPATRDPCSFDWTNPDTKEKVNIRYMGAGHIAGTCRMGTTSKDSVVDANLRSWDFDNLYIVGSSVFPTLGTANPTLTIAALSLRLGEHLAGSQA